MYEVLFCTFVLIVALILVSILGSAGERRYYKRQAQKRYKQQKKNRGW